MVVLVVVVLSRNFFANLALKEDCDYILYHDSDIIPPKDALLKLLNHNVDVCAGLCATSKIPFEPAVYKVTNWKLGGKPLKDIPDEGLLQVDWIGTGFILIKTRVFRKISRPYFHYGWRNKGEDYYFCHKLHKKKIPVHVDCSVKCSHDLMFEVDSEGRLINGEILKSPFESD